MAFRSASKFGIVAQALVWLVFGTIVVVGLAVWISYEATVSSNRNDLLQNLSRLNEDRTAREMAVIDRVERQVHETRRLLGLRLQWSVEQLTIPQQDDGSRRQIPETGKPPLAVFINLNASAERKQVAAAVVARDLLAELAPTLAEYPSNLSIAMPTGWFAGWGHDQVHLARDILPIDPVILPAEVAGLGSDHAVAWSEPFLEPLTERWQVTASTALTVDGIGTIAIRQVLPMDDLIKRATEGHTLGGDTVVFGRGGRLLAGTGLEALISRAAKNETAVMPTLTTSGLPTCSATRWLRPYWSPVSS